MIRRDHCALCWLAGLCALWLPDQAQSQEDQGAPNRGDIVVYEKAGQTKYGLVIDLEYTKITVEIVGRGGQIESDWILPHGDQKCKVVDRFQKRPAFSPRIWNSANGKFKINATLQTIEGDKVRLTKDDGTTIDVPISDLSSRDQDYIKKVGGDVAHASDDSFADETAGDLPGEVLRLRERRTELLELEAIHQRLAKRNPTPVVGDIILYEKFPHGTRYGLIVGSDIFGPSIEYIDEDGSIDVDRSFGEHTSWKFFDRPAGLGALENRTWSSSGGKFKISATMQGVSGDKVELKKTNGDIVVVELSKLSQADQDFVERNRQRLSSDAAAEDVERRANYPAEVQQLIARRGEVLKLSMANRQSAEDVSKMAFIRLKTGSFNLEPDQLIPLKLGQASFSQLVKLQNVVQHAHIQGVCYASASGHIAFVAGTPFEGAQALAVVDSKTGAAATSSEDLGQNAHALAISPSGTTVVVYSAPATGKQLELWRHADGLLQKISAVSYESFFTPTMLLFSDTRGAVMNSEGQLTFFDIDERIIPTHLVSTPKQNGAQPSRMYASHNGKILFYLSSSNNALYGIDIESNECIGGISLPASKQQGPGAPTPIAQISPNGEQLVVALGSSITFLSLQTGEEVSKHEIENANFQATPFRNPYSELQLISPDLIVIANRSVYDLRLGLEIGSIKDGFSMESLQFADATRVHCEIDHLGGAQPGLGGFGTSDDTSGLMQIAEAALDETAKGRGRRSSPWKNISRNVVVSMQHLPVDQIIAQAESLGDKDILVLGKGDTVQLTMDLGQGGPIENSIRSKVESDLAAGGIKLSNNSDFKLHLEYKVGQPVTRTYRIIGNGPPQERTVTVTPRSCTAIMRYRDEVIWTAANSGGLGNPSDVESLDRNIQHANSVSPQDFVNFKYPSSLRLLLPSKRLNLAWQ